MAVQKCYTEFWFIFSLILPWVPEVFLALLPVSVMSLFGPTDMNDTRKHARKTSGTQATLIHPSCQCWFIQTNEIKKIEKKLFIEMPRALLFKRLPSITAGQ